MKSTFTPDEAQGRCDLTWPLMENTKNVILWRCKLYLISKIIGERKHEGIHRISIGLRDNQCGKGTYHMQRGNLVDGNHGIMGKPYDII